MARNLLELLADIVGSPSPPQCSEWRSLLVFQVYFQVCYINDLKDEEDDDSSDDELFVPKSKSAPNLQSSVLDGSNLNATQLRQAVSAISKSSTVFLVFGQ